MEEQLMARSTSVTYWDGNARWFQLWYEHNKYHNCVLEMLMDMVRPGWKILDIGAGNGVLSLPLSAIGCKMRALEPSYGMRNLLYREASRRGIDWIRVDNRRWEDFHDCLAACDLVIACNSLHLTTLGLENSLDKIFRLRPKNIFVVSEEYLNHLSSQFLFNDYALVCTKHVETESSFAYHTLSEAYEHWSYKNGRTPTPSEKTEIRSKLIWKHNHFWIQDMASVNMYWWTLNVQDRTQL